MGYRDRDRITDWLECGGGDGLTTLDRGLLRDIAEFANTKTGRAYPGVDRLAARHGVDERSVKRSIARLHRHGLISTAARGHWRKRAEYVLDGQALRVTDGSPNTGGPAGHPTRVTETRHRVTQVSPQGDRNDVIGGPVGHPDKEDSGAIAERSARSAGAARADAREVRQPWRCRWCGPRRDDGGAAGRALHEARCLWNPGADSPEAEAWRAGRNPFAPEGAEAAAAAGAEIFNDLSATWRAEAEAS